MANIEDKFTLKKTLQFLLGFIGVISAILGIVSFFQEKETQISYEVISNTNVLDINADLNKLDIIYDGNSLKSNKQSLQIINLNVKNTGTECILKTFYDNQDPLGIVITNGKIIERPEILTTSSDYIKKNLRVKLDSLNQIQ